ncbi:MAG: DUF308 domain-containing protein [Clostridia bacterium]|nr:DUF308 domain-containing protein [Clostridia bacterium]
MNELSEKLKKKAKNVKRTILFLDLALFALGLLMVIFPQESANIICIAVGIILTIWGVIRLISYFTADKAVTFSSFALVQGVALMGFGIFFIACPEMLRAFLSIALAIILIVCGVMKLQYAIESLKVKSKLWPVSLAGAIVSIVLGIIIFFNPEAGWLMLFIGIAFLISSVWDIIAVFLLTKAVKDFAESKDRMVDVEVTKEDTEE